MGRRIKGAVFDLDGVLVDTAKYHYMAWKRLAAKLGFVFTENENERLKGVSRMRSLDILLEAGGMRERFTEPEKEELADQKNDWYVAYISKLQRSELLPGAVECLHTLRGENIRISLGSASKNSMIILEGLEIADLFDAIVDGNRIEKAKPDPEVFLTAARELGLLPEDCMVFEDAQAGIEAGNAAGMYTVAIDGAARLNGYCERIDGVGNFKKLKIWKKIET